ncbi:MAG TPA: ferrous iron transport protein B [Saprospirales bacterium]|nr:ferrous iron transport protein B [Saprospirales bacterium]
MSLKSQIKAGLIGNPNSGKSSLFNNLTGLNQHVSNFPGITVDKKTGIVKLPHSTYIEIIDFPGCYSLYPNSGEEKLVVEILSNPDHPDYPDFIIFVVDATDVRRQLLLATQIRDLGLPVLMVMTMKDLADKRGMQYDTKGMSMELGFPTLLTSNISGEGLDELKDYLFAFRKVLIKGEKAILVDKSWGEDFHLKPGESHHKPELQQLIIKQTDKTSSEERNNAVFYSLNAPEKAIVEPLRHRLSASTDYQALIQIHHSEWLEHLTPEVKAEIAESKRQLGFKSIPLQIDETLQRYNLFSPLVNSFLTLKTQKGPGKTDFLDRVITHKVFGPLIFFMIMLLVFQIIFSWAELPMTWIESAFGSLGAWTESVLPAGWFSDLIVQGVIPGVGGVMVFIPQIFLLFLMIGIMEEIGYMSRVVYMFDQIMKQFGLNGRSLISLISGGACAIPAIMSTRTISQQKERLITILITPLISCSARIPVYTLLIGFAVPDVQVYIFNARGLAFMGLYVLGILMAFISAIVMKYVIKAKERSFLMLSLPEYKRPRIKNISLFVREKVGAFIIQAGKIILLISIVLWALASYGPTEKMDQAEKLAISYGKVNGFDEAETGNLIAAKKIEASYAGHLGKFIEPAIKPLGFDWKIGIALITSFAAREVFVGTMATIYAIGSESENLSVSQKMAADVNLTTGEKVYSPATSWSLLIFYVFALQCLSTIAITRRETGSWKWPIVQFLYMGVLAYAGSYFVFQLLSL